MTDWISKLKNFDVWESVLPELEDTETVDVPLGVFKAMVAVIEAADIEALRWNPGYCSLTEDKERDAAWERLNAAIAAMKKKVEEQ